MIRKIFLASALVASTLPLVIAVRRTHAPFVCDFNGVARHGEHPAYHGFAAFERKPDNVLFLDFGKTLR